MNDISSYKHILLLLLVWDQKLKTLMAMTNKRCDKNIDKWYALEEIKNKNKYNNNVEHRGLQNARMKLPVY